MSSTLFVFLCLAALSSALVYKPRRHAPVEVQFEEYLTFWNKTYAAEEKSARLATFIKAGERIKELNHLNRRAKFGYTKFADIEPEEFKRTYLGFRKSTDPSLPRPPVVNPTENLKAPSGAIDWVAAGKTTPVKNQEQCGSCWAFSAVETAESANLMAGRSVQPGSPQEIVDCDSGEDGCNGGDPRQALQWLQSQGGLELDSCYPYAGVNQNCQQSSCSPSFTVTGVNAVAEDESEIYSALQQAPLSICCYAEPWQYYQGGIMDSSSCPSTPIDHAIQLTGYSPSQGGYWIVRNSWGTDWGENGFIWLAYGQDTCGITSEVTGATA